jgi:hypothetical protein
VQVIQALQILGLIEYVYHLLDVALLDDCPRVVEGVRRRVAGRGRAQLTLCTKYSTVLSLPNGLRDCIFSMVSCSLRGDD